MQTPAKIFSAEQIRRADQDTIKTEPIASVDLMERAASACVNWIVQRYTTDTSFAIFCGPGNNGGDGLAMARLLHTRDYSVTVYDLTGTSQNTDDFRVNLERWLAVAPGAYHCQANKNQPPSVTAGTVIVDAIFGTGLSRPITGAIEECIRAINAAELTVLSIDMPSGLLADGYTDPASAIVKATVTLSFQFPKLAFFFPSNAAYVGDWEVLDIGLSKKFMAAEPANQYFLTEPYIRSLRKSRPRFSHKGNFGHALLIAGAYGKMGAALLATEACLRSGVGLLTVHVPEAGYPILQSTHPEAMASVDRGEHLLTNMLVAGRFTATGVGPGIGTDPVTQQALLQLLQNATGPLVLDADALNLISLQENGPSLIPENSILTPHPKEFERLAGKTEHDFARYETQKKFSERYKVYVVLKGAFSCITTPQGESYFNTTGNPGMAKGGSGDVLTGILTGLLAQGYPPKDTCLLGVYLHGLAGDLACRHLGETAMLAGDIVRYLPEAFISLQ